MMRSFLPSIFALVFLIIAVVHAIPSSPHCPQNAPWRRFSDFLIEAIWGPSPKSKAKAIDQYRGYNGRQHVPGNFLARYGRDVVLRFNVTTEDEAASLAEAADVLFLDVWDFTEDWLDVRLAKDVVSYG